METELPKQNARLENWYVGEDDLLHGTVYGHPKLPDGTFIYTSRVVSLDKITGKAVTRNTNYELGKHVAQDESGE